MISTNQSLLSCKKYYLNVSKAKECLNKGYIARCLFGSKGALGRNEVELFIAHCEFKLVHWQNARRLKWCVITFWIFFKSTSLGLCLTGSTWSPSSSLVGAALSSGWELTNLRKWSKKNQASHRWIYSDVISTNWLGGLETKCNLVFSVLCVKSSKKQRAISHVHGRTFASVLILYTNIFNQIKS